MLIGRFSGQSYIWRASQPRRPIPIVRQVNVDPGWATEPAWWLLG